MMHLKEIGKHGISVDTNAANGENSKFGQDGITIALRYHLLQLLHQLCTSNANRQWLASCHGRGGHPLNFILWKHFLPVSKVLSKAVASIPIPGECSLHPVKTKGGNYFKSADHPPPIFHFAIYTFLTRLSFLFYTEQKTPLTKLPPGEGKKHKRGLSLIHISEPTRPY